jgi:hypothetical protein
MTSITITRYVLLLVTAALVLYDIWVYYYGGEQATISNVIRNDSRDFPIVPFLIGALCAHLFWRD